MARAKIKLTNSNGLTPDALIDRLSNDDISIQEFYELHKTFVETKTLEGLAPRTIKDYLSHMIIFKKYVESEKRITSNRSPISNELFKGYLSFMLIEKQLSPFTVNIRVATLKAYLTWLYNNGYAKNNYSLILKKVKTPEDSIKPLSVNDIKLMLSAPDRTIYSGFRDFTIMVLILDTGIRIQELCNTLIDDIDFTNKLLKVRGTVSKTRRFRELPLSKQSILLLKQLVDISKENESSFVFLSSTTGEKLNHHVVIKNFEKYGKKIGIKLRCTPHVFRHTAATSLVKQGCDVFTLQRILGHSNITTTRKYIQLETSDLKRVHEKASILNAYL